jgi:hypothetical protein
MISCKFFFDFTQKAEVFCVGQTQELSERIILVLKLRNPLIDEFYLALFKNLCFFYEQFRLWIGCFFENKILVAF